MSHPIVTHRVIHRPYGEDDQGFGIDYFYASKSPLDMYRLETRFGERHLTREVLGSDLRQDLTHLLQGRRGRSRQAFCDETQAVLDGRGIRINGAESA